MDGYTNFPQDAFATHVATFYPLAINLLGRDLHPDVRIALQHLLRRVGEVKLGLPLQAPVENGSGSA